MDIGLVQKPTQLNMTTCWMHMYRSISFLLFNQKSCSLAFYTTIAYDSYIPPTFSYRECFYHLIILNGGGRGRAQAPPPPPPPPPPSPRIHNCNFFPNVMFAKTNLQRCISVLSLIVSNSVTFGDTKKMAADLS